MAFLIFSEPEVSASLVMFLSNYDWLETQKPFVRTRSRTGIGRGGSMSDVVEGHGKKIMVGKEHYFLV